MHHENTIISLAWEPRRERLEVRYMKRSEVILKAIDGKITWIQAAQILGISDRQMRRLKARYMKIGFNGIIDRRIQKKPHNLVPGTVIKEILDLYRTTYFDFNVKHFHEEITRNHGITQGYTWTKNVLQQAGLIAKDSKRGPHRKKRERKPLTGMMLHLDGSTHPWFLDQPDFNFDLMIILDDANNEIYDGLFAPQEDTLSSLTVIKNTIQDKGIFCSLYTDRGSHFKVTNKKNSDPDKIFHSHIEKVLHKFGTKLIHAFSPQARGRGERMWQTVQGRIPQELRLHKISTIDEANRFLREIFIPKMNSLFKKTPPQEGTAFLPLPTHIDLDRACAFEHERTVKADNTIEFQNRILQIPKSEIRFSFTKCKVTVLEFLNKKIEIFYGPHLIASFETPPLNPNFPLGLSSTVVPPTKKAA
jgi:hypothetical protein